MPPTYRLSLLAHQVDRMLCSSVEQPRGFRVFPRSLHQAKKHICMHTDPTTSPARRASLATATMQQTFTPQNCSIDTRPPGRADGSY